MRQCDETGRGQGRTADEEEVRVAGRRKDDPCDGDEVEDGHTGEGRAEWLVGREEGRQRDHAFAAELLDH